jgi:hypothetical protein
MARARSIAFSAATIAACLLCAWPVTITPPGGSGPFPHVLPDARDDRVFDSSIFHIDRTGGSRISFPGKLFERFSRVRSCSDKQKDRPKATSLFASIELHLLSVFFILVVDTLNNGGRHRRKIPEEAFRH